MFRLLTTTIAIAVSAASFADSHAADTKTIPRRIIDKGIKFLGGAKNLKRYKGATWTEKGVYYGMGEGLLYTSKYAVEWPDKFRMEVVGFFTTVLNGDKAWSVGFGTATKLTKEQAAQRKSQQYFGMVARLHPLRGKQFTLTYDGEAKVDGKAVVIVKVESQGHQDARLFFDTETGAMVKSELKAPLEYMPTKLAAFVTYYSNYKSAGRVKYASKIRMTRDGKKFLEATLTDYKPAESVDPKLFAPK